MSKGTTGLLTKRMRRKRDPKPKGTARQLVKRMKRCWQLYVFLLPAVVYVLLFVYKPMYGILIAFKDFSIREGIWGSSWVGFANFERLFRSYWFPVILKNTLMLSGLSLIIGFPLPILFALLLNEVRSKRFRSTVQTVSYAPHFISTVVICSMIQLFLNPSAGVVNQLLGLLGVEPIYFMQEASLFKWIYVISGIWQGLGWSSIIYYAALSGVDKSLLEAADMDGATRLQKIIHVNIPVLVPTMVVMLILKCGSLLSVGYEKVFLLQTDTNITASEVISTYVYKVGLVQSDFSFSTAASLFNSVVNAIILIIVNTISKKVSDNALW